MVPEPTALSLGVLPGDQFDTAQGLFQSQFAAEVGGEFRYAMGAHRRQGRIQFEVEEGANFLEGTVTQHGG